MLGCVRVVRLIRMNFDAFRRSEARGGESRGQEASFGTHVIHVRDWDVYINGECANK